MSLIKTKLLPVLANYDGTLDKFENRVTINGLLEAVIEQSNSNDSLITQELETAYTNTQARTIDIPVFKKGTVTIKNARTCDVECGESETDLYRVTTKTVVADICMVPSQYEENKIGYNQDLGKRIREMVEAFKNAIESDLEAAFDANKTQVYNSPIVGDKYALVGSAIQVTPADVDFFFGDISAINFADDFSNPNVKIIANHTIMPTVERIVFQGAANAVNLQYQLSGKDFRFTNGITNGAGVKGTMYFMPNGSLGMMTRVAWESRNRVESTRGTKWDTTTLPGLPFAVGVKYDSECSDQSAIDANGLGKYSATLIEHWQFSFDFSIIEPYNSDPATKAGPIRKVEFV